jgi:chemotaxis protein histidine kinase CheA
MSTALTANYVAHTETTTVSVALLSTSLIGIDPNDLVSMGQPFFSHASIDQSYSFSSGSNGASVAIPAGTLDPAVPISISLLTDSADQRALIGGTGTSVLSVVVSWVAPDGSVPSTNSGKAISVTLTNSAIKAGAKIYSIIGSQSTLLGTASADGAVTTLITDDPVLLVINPVVTPPSSNNVVVQFDNSAAIAAAKEFADKNAAEEAAAAAALKAAQEKMAADAKALAEAKAAADAAALKAAQDAAETSAKEAAVLQAAKDAAIAAANAAKAIKPAVTLYTLSSSLKLSAYDSAYLTKYVKSLKNGASVTCIGYTYGKTPVSTASQALAKRQATAVCSLMKKVNKTLKTSIVIYPATKAPKAAVGAKWVGVSYRIDGFRTKP